MLENGSLNVERWTRSTGNKMPQPDDLITLDHARSCSIYTFGKVENWIGEQVNLATNCNKLRYVSGYYCTNEINLTNE